MTILTRTHAPTHARTHKAPTRRSLSLCVTAGWVLSSFFIGYLFLQVPAGLLSQRFGGKWFMGVGILATSVLTLLTPVAANLSVWALVAVRVLEGLFEVREAQE